MDLVICETTAAITLHLREVTQESPVMLSGSNGKTFTLCGAKSGWDTQIPLGNERCRKCIGVARKAV